MNDEINTCSICNKVYANWGNNAAPFFGRCCDSCNAKFIIPMRMKLFREQPAPNQKDQPA